MEITDIRIRRIENDSKMKGIVSITFNNEFVVHDMKIIDGQNGLFIAMPSRRMENGEFRDIAHPINKDSRQRIQDRILKEYERVLTTE